MWCFSKQTSETNRGPIYLVLTLACLHAPHTNESTEHGRRGRLRFIGWWSCAECWPVPFFVALLLRVGSTSLGGFEWSPILLVLGGGGGRGRKRAVAKARKKTMSTFMVCSKAVHPGRQKCISFKALWP